MSNFLDKFSLSPIRRDAVLNQLETETVDVLVIGGGVVGAGAALDAASRGLTVAIVEARDWGSGTSSRSSKLVHGGIRYLEQLNFGLVHEALVERDRLLHTIAPHLVKPVQFLYPLRKRFVERAYIGAGMALYDVLSGWKRKVPLHRHLDKKRVHAEMPGLDKDSFVGGVSYFDAQVDDARLVVTLLRTAVAEGARAVSRTRVTAISSGDDLGDTPISVSVHDEETGRTRSISAWHVVNATGVWSDRSEEMLGSRLSFEVTASKGVHFLVPRDRIALDQGLILRTEKSVLFVIPWEKHWIIGTTDTPWDFDRNNPAPTRTDIDYLLAHVNKVLAHPLKHSDIVGVYAGLRPLVAGKAGSTAALSREHSIDIPRPGVAVIAGGKLTTYRVMAKDVVDAVLDSRRTEAYPSRTESLPLLGACAKEEVFQEYLPLFRSFGFEDDVLSRLIGRYGYLISEIAELLTEDQQLQTVLPGTGGTLLAEIAYAVLAEDARDIEDVLLRRTRLAIEREDAGLGIIEPIADVMGHYLDWNEEEQATQLARYRDLVERERTARRQSSDEQANEILTSTPVSELSAVPN